MAETTIVLQSPVKSSSSSSSSSLLCSSPNPLLNSPTHNNTIIVLKDSNNNDQQQKQPTKDSQSFSVLKSVQSKLYYVGYTGLYNLGNTCYVNCVLQLLSHVPQFCDAICSMSFESLGLEQPSDVPMVASSHNPTRLKGGGRGLLKALEAQPRRVPCYLAYELHGTFNIIWSGKCMVYSPLNMVAAVRNLLPSFEPCAMEDAQEFLEALLSGVTDEIKTNKLADTNIINDLLGFSSDSQILCEQCHRLSVTSTDETFITLTFSEKMLGDSRGSSRRRSCHLTEMLAQFYQWEALSTPFQCSHCAARSLTKEGTKAQKRLLISKLPQVLHVVLRRFRSLPQTNLRRPTSRQARQLSHKITLHVNFDEYLDMAPYCSQHNQTIPHSSLSSPTRSTGKRNSSSSTSTETTNTIDPSQCLYRLRGVIVHYGKSINTGHFVAFVYNDVVGEWLRCDDHVIEPTTFESVKTADAYILVYSRCTTLNPPSSPSNSSMSNQPVSCRSRKRTRAVSVDNLNEQQQTPTLRSSGTLARKQTSDRSIQNADMVKSLKFFCGKLDPVTNGLRRRAQSLNFSIRSNHTESIRQMTPLAKRRRKDETHVRRPPTQNYCATRISARSKSTLSLSPQHPTCSSPILRRKKPPSDTTDSSLPIAQQTAKTVRKRRRVDPFSRKRRVTKTSNRKNRRKVALSNLVHVPVAELSSIPPLLSESSFSPVQSSLSTCEIPQSNISSPFLPVAKRVGRVRIQRSLDANLTSRVVATGDNIRSSLSPIITSASSSLLASIFAARRSNSLNTTSTNTTSNPFSSS